MKPPFLLTLMALVQTSWGARILAVFPHAGKSHYMVFEPYLKELASRGNEVVVLSHFPQPISVPNLTDISVAGSVKLAPQHGIRLSTVENMNPIWSVLQLFEFANDHCNGVLQHPSVKKLVNDIDQGREHFDLVITELFDTDCFLSIVENLDAPVIYFTSSLPVPWLSDRVGNPDNPSYIPSITSVHSDKMAFFERVKNTVELTFAKWVIYPLMFDIPGKYMAEKHLERPVAPLTEIAKRGSLILVNAHFSFSKPRPLVPAVVEVAGVHIRSPLPLKRDIQEFLDGAEHGAIYFSMGSMIRAETLPNEKRNAFIQAFAELPQRVLWKWESDNFPGQPKNVMIAQWLPQFDILNHPKVRVFLAHGGLLGTIEAVHCGIPMVAIPMYGDQSANVKLLETAGMAISLNYGDITKDNVLRALRTILDDLRYTENAKHISRIFKDRPMSPMETAIYWTEYVIRHRGAPHLRTAGADLPLYQYLLLDVIAFILAAMLLILFLIYFLVKKLLRILSSRKQIMKHD